MVVVYAAVALLAALWLLLLSLLLGWPGFIGMLIFLVGLGFFVPSLTYAIVDERLPERSRSGILGTMFILVGLVGIVSGLIAKLT